MKKTVSIDKLVAMRQKERQKEQQEGKNKLRPERRNAKGATKQTDVPAGLVRAVDTVRPRTAKVTTKPVAAVDLLRDDDVVSRGTFVPPLLPAGEYLACLVGGEAFTDLRVVSLHFILLEGTYKGRPLSLHSYLDPPEEFCRTLDLLDELGLKRYFRNAMTGKVGFVVRDGIAYRCDVALRSSVSGQKCNVIVSVKPLRD